MRKKQIHCEEYKRLIAELRVLRVEQGLRQEDVGRKLGCSADWVGKVEAAEIRLDLLHFVLLCRVYNVRPEELICRFEEGLPL